MSIDLRRKMLFYCLEFLGIFAGIWAFLIFFKSVAKKIQSQLLGSESNITILLKQVFSAGMWAVITLFVIFFIFIIRRIKAQGTWSDLGFRSHGSWGKKIWFSVVIFSLSYIIELPTTIGYLPLRANLSKGGLLTQIIQQDPPYYIIITAVFFMAFATCACAFWEEVYWRGYLQNLLSRKMAPAVGFFTSMLFFSLSHYITRPYDLITVCLVVIGSITLCLALYATGSVWVVLIIHCLGNLSGDYPTFLYLKGSAKESYIFLGILGVISLILCILGKKELRYFFKKTKELFVLSGWKMSLIGILLGIIALFYCWVQNRLYTHINRGVFLAVLATFSLVALAASFFYREKRKGV